MKDIEIDKQDVIDMHEETLRITNGETYASIFTAQDFFSISGEARAEGAKPEYVTNLIAQGLVVKNLAQRLIGNFIMRFNKPLRETRMFQNSTDARAWVLARIKEHEKSKRSKSKMMSI